MSNIALDLPGIERESSPLVRIGESSKLVHKLITVSFILRIWVLIEF